MDKTIQWVNNVSKMVDQTVIPYEFKYVEIKTGQAMFDAIKTMIVRGAPAIGIAGAHGVCLYALELEKENLSREEFVEKLVEKSNYLITSRPTAVNLRWAIEKQIEVIKNSTSEVSTLIKELIDNGIRLENEDIEYPLPDGATELLSGEKYNGTVKCRQAQIIAYSCDAEV